MSGQAKSDYEGISCDALSNENLHQPVGTQSKASKKEDGNLQNGIVLDVVLQTRLFQDLGAAVFPIDQYKLKMNTRTSLIS